MAGQRKDDWKTLSGLDIPPKIGPDGAESAGQAPYTRGIHDTMYRSRLWTMRQYAGFSSAKETNERFRLLLDRGQKGLSWHLIFRHS
jgi:methylmalonyl-CoA mutase N-terminal domain/subunit